MHPFHPAISGVYWKCKAPLSISPQGLVLTSRPLNRVAPPGSVPPERGDALGTEKGQQETARGFLLFFRRNLQSAVDSTDGQFLRSVLS